MHIKLIAISLLLVGAVSCNTSRYGDSSSLLEKGVILSQINEMHDSLKKEKFKEGLLYEVVFEPIDFLLFKKYPGVVFNEKGELDENQLNKMKQTYNEPCNFKLRITGQHLNEKLEEDVPVNAYYSFRNQDNFLLIQGNDTLASDYYHFDLNRIYPSLDFVIGFNCETTENHDLSLMVIDQVFSHDTILFNYSSTVFNNSIKTLSL